MRVLVTGANGMLGQDLCPELKKNGYEIIETDLHNLDITNIEQVESFLSKEKPDIIIHCAAYTNVDKAEENIKIAEKINVIGTENIAKIATKIDSTLVYVSTDYVFDGAKSTPYEINDVANPINNYGLTKLKGEEVVKKNCSKYFITRTSWLYGINGKNFVETMISLANKPELKVVDDQIGCPTWTMELVNGILKLIKTQEYGTYHVCGSDCTSWYGFAKEIFTQLNINANLCPCPTEEFPRPAKRPKYSVMNNNSICRNWKLALADYINLRNNKEN